MNRYFSEPPDVPSETFQALVEHAARCAQYVSEENREAAAHGHVPQGQSLANLEGYQFTALWLLETYADRLPRQRCSPEHSSSCEAMGSSYCSGEGSASAPGEAR